MMRKATRPKPPIDTTTAISTVQSGGIGSIGRKTVTHKDFMPDNNAFEKLKIVLMGIFAGGSKS